MGSQRVSHHWVTLREESHISKQWRKSEYCFSRRKSEFSHFPPLVSPAINILYVYGTFVTINEPVSVHYYWNPHFILISLDFTKCLFSSRIPLSISHQVSRLVWPVIFLIISLIIMFLTVLKSISQIFSRISFKLDFSDDFLMIRLGLWTLGRGTTEVNCHSHHRKLMSTLWTWFIPLIWNLKTWLVESQPASPLWNYFPPFSLCTLCNRVILRCPCYPSMFILLHETSKVPRFAAKRVSL